MPTGSGRSSASLGLGFLEADEDSYFIRAFAEVGVTEDDYADPVLLAPTEGFREVMRTAVASASYPDLLVVLVIAEWLYLDWGEQERDMPTRDVHVGWIDLHRGEDFSAWVQFLVDELERVYPRGDGAEVVRTRERLTALWGAGRRTRAGVLRRGVPGSALVDLRGRGEERRDPDRTRVGGAVAAPVDIARPTAPGLEFGRGLGGVGGRLGGRGESSAQR